MELQLTPEERELLLELLEEHHRCLVLEIARTDHQHFRQVMRTKQKVLEELLLRNQQVSLQDRISDRANKLDFKRPAPLIHVIERIAKVLVQRPADAVVITNRRNNFGQRRSRRRSS